MKANPKIIAIQFLTPFIQTAAYGGTHRPIERIVFRQRKTQDGKPTDEWETPPEYVNWSARVEGPSVFIRPAFKNGPALAEEWEIPRAIVGITWDRTDEAKDEKVAREKAEAEAAKKADKGTQPSA